MLLYSQVIVLRHHSLTVCCSRALEGTCYTSVMLWCSQVIVLQHHSRNMLHVTYCVLQCGPERNMPCVSDTVTLPDDSHANHLIPSSLTWLISCTGTRQLADVLYMHVRIQHTEELIQQISPPSNHFTASHDSEVLNSHAFFKQKRQWCCRPLFRSHKLSQLWQVGQNKLTCQSNKVHKKSKQKKNLIQGPKSSEIVQPWHQQGLTCPCPREMELNLFPEKPLSSANLRRLMVGSAPGDRMKMRGVQLLESLYDLARSKGGGSTNFLPSFSITKSVSASTICLKEILVGSLKQIRKSGCHFTFLHGKYLLLFYANLSECML